VIYQHNSELAEGIHYVIVQGTNRVEILQGVQGEGFEFDARLEEGGEDLGPGDINLIVASANAGPVAISVVGHDGHTYGAENIKEIDLSASGVDGEIVAITMSGNLGDLGPTLADTISGIVQVDGEAISDTIEVTTLTGGIQCETLFDLLVHGDAGTVGQNSAVIVGGSVYGDILVEGFCNLLLDVDGNVYGDIESTNDWLKAIFVLGAVEGNLLIGGDLYWASVGELPGSNLLDVVGDVGYRLTIVDVYGSVMIGGDISAGALLWPNVVHAGGTVAIDGGVAGEFLAAVLDGETTIGGSLSGELSLPVSNDRIPGLVQIDGDVTAAGSIFVGGDISGTLDIGGSLKGDLDIGALSGEVLIGPHPQGPGLLPPLGLLGALYVADEMSGLIQVDWDVDGTITVAGRTSGTINVDGDVSGDIELLGYEGFPVYVGLTGSVVIGGDLSGAIHVAYNVVDVAEDTSGGHIIVDGSFKDAAQIDVDGSLSGSTTFIAID